MKKMLAIALAAMMLLSLAACTAEPNNEEKGAQKYYVGICQLIKHEALDAATKGFKEALEAEMPGQITFDEQNAANDPATCSTIANLCDKTFSVNKKGDTFIVNRYE